MNSCFRGRYGYATKAQEHEIPQMGKITFTQIQYFIKIQRICETFVNKFSYFRNRFATIIVYYQWLIKKKQLNINGPSTESSSKSKK